MAKRIQRGQFYSINNKRVRGHRGRVVNVKKGKVKAVVVTHSPTTRGRENIPLNKNPKKGHSETAYVLKNPEYARTRDVGTHRKNMRITDKQDKSTFRKIGKKNRWDKQR